MVQSEMTFRVEKEAFETAMDQKLDKDEFYARANDNGIGEDSLKKLELEFKKMSKDQVQQLIKQRLFEEKAISEKMQDSILTAVLEQKLKQEKEEFEKMTTDQAQALLEKRLKEEKEQFDKVHEVLS